MVLCASQPNGDIPAFKIPGCLLTYFVELLPMGYREKKTELGQRQIQTHPQCLRNDLIGNVAICYVSSIMQNENRPYNL